MRAHSGSPTALVGVPEGSGRARPWPESPGRSADVQAARRFLTKRVVHLEMVGPARQQAWRSRAGRPSCLGCWHLKHCCCVAGAPLPPRCRGRWGLVDDHVATAAARGHTFEQRRFPSNIDSMSHGRSMPRNVISSANRMLGIQQNSCRRRRTSSSGRLVWFLLTSKSKLALIPRLSRSSWSFCRLASLASAGSRFASCWG